MQIDSMIKVKLSEGVVSARLIKENPLTVWVQLSDGNIIKRHKKKHLIDDSPNGETTEVK